MALPTVSGGFRVIRTTEKASPKELDDELLRMWDGIDNAGSQPGKQGPPGPPGPSAPGAAIQPAQSVTDVGPATGTVGVYTSYAREDHQHPFDGVLSLNGASGVLKNRYTGTVVLGSPSATFAVTHSLAVPTPFLVMIDIYDPTGVLVETAGATFVFTTNGITITFTAPLAADTYNVLVLA